MGIKTRLVELIKERNTNVNELAQTIGIPPSTIYSMISRDSKSINIDMLIKLANALDVTADYLLSDNANKHTPFQLTSKEISDIKKYRNLDEYGKELVSLILDKEYARCFIEEETPANTIQLSYYQKLASAGTGQIVFDSVPVDIIDVPYNELSKIADYAIGVNGDSMENTYFDGDILLVEKTNNISKGDIGIFINGGEAYVKELGDGVLISHNKKYNPIPIHKDCKCMGRVIGKVNKFNF